MTADWIEPCVWAWACTGIGIWLVLVAINGTDKAELNLFDQVCGVIAGAGVSAFIWPFILYAATISLKDR